MITKLEFTNFRSFAGTTVIDFTLGRKPTPTGYDVVLGEQRCNKVIAIVGANGAGKTQILKVFAFLQWFIVESFPRKEPEGVLPNEAHALCGDMESQFSLNFVIDGIEYRYDLVIADGGVVSESLHKKTSSRFSYIFKREKSDSGFTFEQKGFPFEKRDLTANASILAMAKSYNLKEAEPFIDYFLGMFTNVVSGGRIQFQHSDVFEAAKLYSSLPDLKLRLVEAIKEFDLGISDINIVKRERIDDSGNSGDVYLPWGVHIVDDGTKFELPFIEESSGTQSAFAILRYILPVLQSGGIAVIDELDNDLHPHLIPRLLEWFEFEHTNPHQAQLIFTSHTPEVLNVLQKHQVYLVEKSNQRSEAWRLDEVIGLRADDNLYAKYMAVALGATPEL